MVTALEGPIEINADGNISVKNAVAAGDANFNSLSGNIRIDERLYAGGQTSIDAKGNIVQSGDFIAAARFAVAGFPWRKRTEVFAAGRRSSGGCAAGGTDSTGVKTVGAAGRSTGQTI